MGIRIAATGHFDTHGTPPNEQIYFAYGVAAVWLLVLAAVDSRNPHILAAGAEEFRRVSQATLITIGLTATFEVAARFETSRFLISIDLLVGYLLLLSGRAFWRWRLRTYRRGGRFTSRALVIGGMNSAAAIAQFLDESANWGLVVAGVWVPDRTDGQATRIALGNRNVPVLGNDRTLAEALEFSGAHTAIVTDTEHLGHGGIRDLAWDLGDAGVELLLSPNVVDVATSRVELTHIASMPFLSLSEPRFARAAGLRKGAFDRILATVILTLMAPVLLITAATVRFSSPGPTLYLQERIGLNGRPFTMYKFRSMRTGADAELQKLLAQSGTAGVPLAKIDDDPRITPIGRFLRRYSIDELPQLLNVVKGDMSLVGPRPQRDFEVALYDDHAHRRLKVRPGLTGLWQVSGRSDLTWDDALRLDSYYVENWSMTGDLMILARTVRAVLFADGAR
jgi:exopolysaccharide biosynthesis polyprenyl glycosylphosphotransferase